MSILCALGRHTGYWTYPNPDSCHQVRLCQRRDCTSTEERLHHELLVPANPAEIRYWTDDACWARGVCTRCRQLGGPITEIHDWGNFTPKWDEDNRMIVWHVCNHCGRYEEKIPAGTEYAY